MLISLLMGIVPILAVLIVNLVSIWAIPSLLPTSLRRLSFGVSPLVGIWVAFLGAGLVLISSTGAASAFTDRLSDMVSGVLRRSPSSLGLLCLLIGIPLLEFGRYGAWINLESQNDKWSMPGFAIPWVGVITLVALFAVVVVAVVCFIRPHLLGGLVLVLIGWILTITPALLLIISSGTPKITAPAWLRHDLVHWSVQIHDIARRSPTAIHVPSIPTQLSASLTAGTGTVATYVAGVLVAFAGLLICGAMTLEGA
jgi:hypothetical protein